MIDDVLVANLLYTFGLIDNTNKNLLSNLKNKSSDFSFSGSGETPLVSLEENKGRVVRVTRDQEKSEILRII